MIIGSIDIAKKVLIIAEAGNCHEGDIGRAKEMVHRAKEVGADAIKFQTIVPERLVSADQTERLMRLRQFQLAYTQFEELAAEIFGKEAIQDRIGKVLEIGGLKEKSLAALRAGIKTIVIPKDNLRDLVDLPKDAKAKLTFIPARSVQEVLDVALQKPKRARRA